jgi:hypothetical protein
MGIDFTPEGTLHRGDAIGDEVQFTSSTATDHVLPVGMTGSHQSPGIRSFSLLRPASRTPFTMSTSKWAVGAG